MPGGGNGHVRDLYADGTSSLDSGYTNLHEIKLYRTKYTCDEIVWN